MKSIVYWYTSEVFKWRTGAAVAWLLILLPTLVSIYITAANFCILHPFLWISSTFGCILKLSTWGYIILLSVLTALTVICDSAYYTVQGNVIGNRAGYLWTLVQLSHVFHGAVHAVAGGVITWCCVQIVGGGYQGLSLQCEPARTSACLNEHHLFIVFHGVYAGYFYSVTFFLQNKNYLEFPVIQQAKFFQVKSGISPQLLESTVTTLKLMRFYYLGYFLIGAIPKEWIIYTLNLEKSPAAPLNSVFGLLDISLFWQTLVTGVFLHFVWSLGVVLFKAYNTEPLQLPIESSFGEESSRCLHHALSCKLSILQYLGYLDLYLLSKFSKERRKQIYSLSQPGGHPHNWTSLCTQCLTSIDALTSAVRQHNDNTVGNGALPLRQPSGERATNRDKGNFLGFNPAMTSIRNHTSHVSRGIACTCML
ncbi:nucleoporin NDC1-like [Lingula anatina]|uniref:Nucleoporin NDC1-like n=1 Tax=Lingula anatina TaxID=7574 RepID=A0A1S3JPJ5_LINAN|nr:nucleoporin NDC1-like [Lingula anatina]|eukprot:XP_013412056.1 nucleoporin NDC1-like [Lingula anatina]